MEKPIILNSAPKSKCYKSTTKSKIKLNTKKSHITKTLNPSKSKQSSITSKELENYLNFYDDIKIPTRRYDW